MAHRLAVVLASSSVAVMAGCGPHVAAPAPTPAPWIGSAAPPASSSSDGGASEPVWNHATPYPDRIVLTWSEDPTTTQSVTWRTDTSVPKGWAQVARATDGPLFDDPAIVVEAKTELVDARGIVGARVAANYHSATFRDLEPGSVYAYRVGDGERWSEWFQFRTAGLEPEPFTFLYFGDAQNDILSQWSRMVRGAYAKAPDARFMIHAGDLVNRGYSDRDWGEWYRGGGYIPAMVPVLPAPGNHEYALHITTRGDTLTRRVSLFWRPQFTLPENGAPGVTPETSYYLDYQGVRIVVLNSSEDQKAQAAWLEKVLAESPARWTVAVHHHPLYSTAIHRDNRQLREAWKPIYDRYGVDLVLQGHDHTYGRGFAWPVDGNQSDGVGAVDGEAGTVYVVSVAGPKMYDFSSDTWDHGEATLNSSAEDTQLYQVVEVVGDTLRYRAFTAAGRLYDSFDLEKRPGLPNRLVNRADGSR